MNKHLIVIGTAVLLLVVGLCGCMGDKVENNESSIVDKFIGTWKLVEQSYGTYDEIAGITETPDETKVFYENSSVKSVLVHHNKYNETDTSTLIQWYEWNLFDNKLFITTMTDSQNNTVIWFDYGISSNGKILVLTIPLVVTMTYEKEQ